MPKTKEKEGLVGKVTHLYRKIDVVIVKLSGSVSVGDTLHFTGSGHDFEEKISSIQINHKDVSSAKKGDEVGMKISGPAREGDEVYKE
ncbi:MAG: translation elongation factor-like protein [Minisyncoccia bacterium]|jgi:putative protease